MPLITAGDHGCVWPAELRDLHAEPPGGIDDEAGDYGLCPSRGSLTTKIHPAGEKHQKPLGIVITAGQRGNSPQFQAVLGPSGSPSRPAANRASAWTGYWPIRPLGPAPTALTCDGARSNAPP